MGRHLPVVAAVIHRRGQILIARRPLDKARPGQWEFPGGKIDPGEAPTSALAREIQEELGCTVTVGEHLVTVHHHYPDLDIELSAYWAELFIGEPYPHDVLGIAWVEPSHLGSIELSEADQIIAQAIRAAPLPA